MNNDGSQAALRLNDQLGPTPARWYVLDRHGMATLCADEDDARKLCADADELLVKHGPHRAMQLADAAELAAALELLARCRAQIEAYEGACYSEPPPMEPISALLADIDAVLGPNAELSGPPR
jgi:rhamnose utilization protein RhaD (predicted bifunctional aldolase and dehydrogenase)